MCHQRLLEVFFCSNESFEEKMVDPTVTQSFARNTRNTCENLGGGFQSVLFSQPYLGKMSNLTNIFQVG